MQKRCVLNILIFLHFFKSVILYLEKPSIINKTDIILNRKSIHIGYFDTLEQAIEERRKAENEYYGEFSLHNSVKYKEECK